MRHFLKSILTVVVFAAAVSTGVRADVRVKDIAHFEGVRENQLVGYGLVVGLNGTGDTLRNSPFTETTIGASDIVTQTTQIAIIATMDVPNSVTQTTIGAVAAVAAGHEQAAGQSALAGGERPSPRRG